MVQGSCALFLQKSSGLSPVSDTPLSYTELHLEHKTCLEFDSVALQSAFNLDFLLGFCLSFFQTSLILIVFAPAELCHLEVFIGHDLTLDELWIDATASLFRKELVVQVFASGRVVSDGFVFLLLGVGLQLWGVVLPKCMRKSSQAFFVRNLFAPT